MLSILRYYYYFEDEKAPIQTLIDEWKNHNITLKNGYSLQTEADGSPGIYCEHKLENLNILVVRLHQASKGWPEYVEMLDSWETKTCLKSEELIARIDVFAGTGENWGQLFEQAQKITSSKEALPMDIDEGKLARLGQFWPDDRAFYVCGLNNETSLNQVFLLRGLPLVEAALLRLKAISSFLRDQKITIAREKDHLDHELSGMLHSHLVSDKGGRSEAQELEVKIDELSVAYGKLAGDYGTVLNGINRLGTMLDALVRQLRSEKGLNISAELLEEIVFPYKNRLNELQELGKDLKISRENHQAVIEVVRSKIEIMNARANITTQEEIRALMELNITMQKQSLIFQYAAGLIEFIVLAYYSHTLWSHLAHAAFVAIPSGIQFLVVLLFSGNTVYCTHLLAEYLQGDHHVKRHLILASLTLSIIFIVIMAASILIAGGSGH